MKQKSSFPALPVLAGLLALSRAPHLFASPHRERRPSSPVTQDIPVGKGANDLQLSVVAEGPGTRNTPLQIACFFEHQQGGDMYSGGTGDFVQKTRGLIKSLRDRAEFGGYEIYDDLLVRQEGAWRFARRTYDYLYLDDSAFFGKAYALPVGLGTETGQ